MEEAMPRVIQLCLGSLAATVMLLMVSAAAVAGPGEDANAALDRWSAAYTSNNVDAVVNSYWPDAILLGTTSPATSTGGEAIRGYFTGLKLAGSGNKNAIQERHTIVLGDGAVVVTGFYEFVRMTTGTPVPAPSRFTMLLTKRGDEWRIAHHHSSPRAQPK
jgi:uncharacterized protein (TIGR02246 family)